MTTTQQLTSHEKELVSLMQLLSDPTRFKIMKLLQASGPSLCVSEIAQQLGISVSAASQHFKQFEACGLVSRERSGQRICYVVSPQTGLTKSFLNLL